MPPKVLLAPARHKPVHVRSRGYLPHWALDDALYFITFRLADSLPQHVLASLESDRQAIIRMVTRGGKATAIQNEVLHRKSGQCDVCREGTLWEREYFDRIIRGPQAL